MPSDTRAAGRVVAAERRFRSRRQAGRRRALRPAILVAAVGTVVAAAVWVAFASPVLTVTTVTVNGTSRLTATEVRTAARVPVGSSMLTISLDAIKHRVALLPAVARVRIERRWPHTVSIDVTERVAVAVVIASGGDELLDRTGVAFAAVPSPVPGLASVTVHQPVPGAGEAAAAAAVRVWEGVPMSLRTQITGMDATSADDVVLHLSAGRVVVWGSADDMAAKISALTALLGQRARIYDVSTPSVAVTRG